MGLGSLYLQNEDHRESMALTFPTFHGIMEGIEFMLSEEAMPSNSRDDAIARAMRYIKQANAEIKLMADDIGDDHSVNICNCGIYGLYYVGLQWLHDYGDSTHTAIREAVGLDENDNIVYELRCTECGKGLD
jgi:hypothetical protein